jgi:hypothetical protein
MIAHLKQWWTVHSTIILSVVAFFVPSVQTYVSGHPKTLVAGVLTLVISALFTSKPGGITQ